MTRYNLLNQEETSIPDDWFLSWSSQADRQASPCGPIWKSAIEQLKSNRTNLRNITFEKVARLMTQPLTDAHLSDLAPATANDAAKRQPLEDLWRFFIAALMEWPSNYTSNLAGVLEHIQKRQGGPYKGQLMVEGELLLWKDLPYFEHVWRRDCQTSLELVIPACLNQKTLDCALIQYIKEQEIAAIIASCKIFEEGLFTYQGAFRHVVETLEQTPQSLVPVSIIYSREGRLELDLVFRLPGVESWLRHCGTHLYALIMKENTKDWDQKYRPNLAIALPHPTDRWYFWKGRLENISRMEKERGRRGKEQRVKEAMEECLKRMTDIQIQWKKMTEHQQQRCLDQARGRLNCDYREFDGDKLPK